MTETNSFGQPCGDWLEVATASLGANILQHQPAREALSSPGLYWGGQSTSSGDSDPKIS